MGNHVVAFLLDIPTEVGVHSRHSSLRYRSVIRGSRALRLRGVHFLNGNCASERRFAGIVLPRKNEVKGHLNSGHLNSVLKSEQRGGRPGELRILRRGVPPPVAKRERECLGCATSLRSSGHIIRTCFN